MHFYVLMFTSTCVDTVPQLSTHNSGIVVIPASTTHCSPHSIDADLHSACTLNWSINQTKCFISAALDSCGEKDCYPVADCPILFCCLKVKTQLCEAL